MGLFTNGVEKAMFKQLFDAPFNDYERGKSTNITNMILDFCASVAHNRTLFPNGVPKNNRENILYCLYTMGTQLVSGFVPAEESEQAVSTATKGLANTLMKSGTTRDFAVNRLTMISQIMDSVNQFIDKKTSESSLLNEHGAFIMAYLMMLKANITPEVVDALNEEIDKFEEVVDEYNKAWA